MANRVTSSRTRASSIVRSVCCWVWAGAFFATILRARASAEFTEVVEVSGGDLGSGVAEDVGQHQRRPLVAWKMLKGGDEGQLSSRRS